MNGQFRPALHQSRSPWLLHQDVTESFGVPVAIIWTIPEGGLVSSAGVSAAAEPDVGVVWIAVVLLVAKDADSYLEVTSLGIETLPVAVPLQGAALQQTLPRVPSQQCSTVFTISDQVIEWIRRESNRFERPVTIVVHSDAHFREGSRPVSSEFCLFLFEATSPCCWSECYLVFPKLWIPLEGVLKLIVRISNWSTWEQKRRRNLSRHIHDCYLLTWVKRFPFHTCLCPINLHDQCESPTTAFVIRENAVDINFTSPRINSIDSISPVKDIEPWWGFQLHFELSIIPGFSKLRLGLGLCCPEHHTGRPDYNLIWPHDNFFFLCFS